MCLMRRVCLRCEFVWECGLCALVLLLLSFLQLNFLLLLLLQLGGVVVTEGGVTIDNACHGLVVPTRLRRPLLVPHLLA